MFNRREPSAKGPSQQSAKQPVQPEATPQVASRQPTTVNPLSGQPSSSRLNVRPPGLGQSTPRSEVPPMPPTSAAHLHQGFVLSVDQSPGEPVVTAITGSVQPRGANVQASAPRDREPGPLKKAAQFFRDGIGKKISGGLGQLKNRLRRAPSSPTAGPERTLAVSAPILVAAPEARRFTQQDVLVRVEGAIRGAQRVEEALGTLNLDSETLKVSDLSTGNGTFRSLATALKTGSQLIEKDRGYDVPDALKEPLEKIGAFYKRPEVARHLIAAGDVSGWAREGDAKIDVQTLRELANEGVELLRVLGEARDSLAPTGTGERPTP